MCLPIFLKASMQEELLFLFRRKLITISNSPNQYFQSFILHKCHKRYPNFILYFLPNIVYSMSNFHGIQVLQIHMFIKPNEQNQIMMDKWFIKNRF